MGMVEELNGTYFYHGHANLTPPELLTQYFLRILPII